MKKKLKNSKKKKKEKIDMLKEKINNDTKMENIQLYIINDIIKIYIFYLIFF